jgi:hypothetical protein
MSALRKNPREENLTMFRFTLEKTRVEKRHLDGRKLVLSLPALPPSRQYDGVSRSESYRDWLARSGLSLAKQSRARLTGPVDVLIEMEDCHPGRDASPCITAVEDLLTGSGILFDDRSGSIRRIAAEWSGVKGLRITLSRSHGRGASV